MSDRPALSVRDLAVTFRTARGPVSAVRDVSFDMAPGEVLGLVGESGSGKSTIGLAALALHDPARTRVQGAVRLGGDGLDLVGASESALKKVRGARVAMVFQDALDALSPYHTIGAQIAEAYRVHHPRAGRGEAKERAAAMLERVGIPAARASDHPHHLSGGMRQRVVIAMALINDPAVLIADEPTTALDARVQHQVLDLIGELRSEAGTAMLLITHDVGVVARTCDRMLVMRDGEALEEGPTERLLTSPAHPYTKALIGAAPTLDTVPGSRLPTVDAPEPRQRTEARLRAAPAPGVLAEVRDLRVDHPGRRRARPHPAVKGVSLHVAHGETLGLVGESGSGKSTIARALTGLRRPTSGEVRFDGRDVSGAATDTRLRRELSRDVQLVFQDPYASLNPRHTVEQIVTTPLRIHTDLDRSERGRRAAELLEQVGLSPSHLSRHPHEFSGGQRQRIGIARALAVRPRLVIADEPVSALDVSVQAQVLNLLMDLREELGLSLLFISHDLAVVRHFCDRIAVLKKGELVEVGPRDAVFDSPAAPYTRELLAAFPHHLPPGGGRPQHVAPVG
ncbi:dipeptide ABC transporter ATP-binding protein [Streptomyces nymphaeiformis]|uniref:Peptide/nickel transport system ATP-binding protein n=1 Tax=Streptomyces nymphaeiformis TaxID=2663842 RepID=A0A7W7U958_9ACTN|nr:ABC transporter ATP-binding protein [Streptomyces nymphaeiformis]MBB4987291.1 peptide/nickel transport system ATP-binding protein [Streptomyces nymphaeiformis]